LAGERYRKSTIRLTHSYVLAELVPLCTVRGFPRPAVLTYLKELVTDPSIELVWVDPPLHADALELHTRRPDKDYSLCDAVSFVLMRRYNLTDALTTDRHFEQEGFARLLK
jgi:predicted nucleic acid-binding protein